MLPEKKDPHSPYYDRNSGSYFYPYEREINHRKTSRYHSADGSPLQDGYYTQGRRYYQLSRRQEVLSDEYKYHDRDSAVDTPRIQKDRRSITESDKVRSNYDYKIMMSPSGAEERGKTQEVMRNASGDSYDYVKVEPRSCFDSRDDDTTYKTIREDKIHYYEPRIINEKKCLEVLFVMFPELEENHLKGILYSHECDIQTAVEYLLKRKNRSSYRRIYSTYQSTKRDCSCCVPPPDHYHRFVQLDKSVSSSEKRSNNFINSKESPKLLKNKDGTICIYCRSKSIISLIYLLGNGHSY